MRKGEIKRRQGEREAEGKRGKKGRKALMGRSRRGIS